MAASGPQDLAFSPHDLLSQPLLIQLTVLLTVPQTHQKWPHLRPFCTFYSLCLNPSSPHIPVISLFVYILLKCHLPLRGFPDYPHKTKPSPPPPLPTPICLHLLWEADLHPIWEADLSCDVTALLFLQ